MTSNRTRIGFIVSIVIAGIVVMLYGGLIYLVERAQGALEQERSVRFAQEARTGEYIALERQAAELEAVRSELRTYLLPREGVIDFLALLESLGGGGTTIETTNISVIDGKDLVDTVALQLRAEGSYEGVVQTLTLLETLPYRTTITGVTLQSTETGTLWTGDFMLTVLKERDI